MGLPSHGVSCCGHAFVARLGQPPTGLGRSGVASPLVLALTPRCSPGRFLLVSYRPLALSSRSFEVRNR